MLVEAPAGYGKTTFLAQLFQVLRERGITAAWYTVAGEIQERQFLPALVHTLHRAGVAFPFADSAIEDDLPGVPLRSVASALLDALVAAEEPVALLIDDFHQIIPEEARSLLEDLVLGLPAHCCLVLATRDRPRMALARLRTRLDTFAIGEADLRFSIEEAQELFGAELSAEHVSELVERSEGWPAALQLARLWLQQPGRAVTDLASFTGQTAELAHYLSEQVFSALPENLRDALMQTSILQRVSGSLVNAVCERSDGWQILEELSRRNAMVVPLDSRAEWYRYHHLFADFLHERLRRLAGATLPQLHRRAALCFLEQDLFAEALFHADRSGDVLLTPQIVESSGGWLLVLRRGESVFGYFARPLPVGATQYPRFALGRVYYLAQTGQLIAARRELELLRKATDGFHVPGRGDWDGTYFAECELVDSIVCLYEDHPLRPADVERLQTALAELPDVDPIVASLITNRLSIAYFDAGDFVRCRVFGEHAVARSRAGGMIYSEIYAQIYLGMALVAVGRLNEAELTYKRARDQAVHAFGSESNQAAMVSVLLAQVSLERDDIPAAKKLIERNLEKVTAQDAWFEVYAVGYLTAAELACIEGGTENAAAILDLARQTASERRLDRLAAIACVHQVNLLLRAGRLADAVELAEGELLTEAVARMKETPVSLLDQELLLMHARLNLLRGCFPESLEAVSRLKLRHENGLRIIQRVRGLLLEATTHLRMRNTAFAANALRLAIVAGAAEGLRRAFLETGAELTPIMNMLLERPGQLSATDKEFLQQLLARLQQTAPDVEAAAPILSARESNVLTGLSNGLSSKEIARELGIAESTVKTYRITLYRKLGAATRSGAIAAARRWRFIL